ncbi:MAG: porin [Myxococcota bacterium]
MWLALATALAADWPRLQGTETAADPPTVRPWGFVQGLGEGIVGGPPVTGLTAPALEPFEGQRAAFNRVGSGDATWGFSVRRARAGLRGAIPGTDGRISWMLSAELGDNGLTRTSPVVLTDASVTASYVPGARLRVGQFKLPLGEEALEMNPIAAEFVSFSEATRQLLLESPISKGAYTGGVSGFRDVGVQAFDSFVLGSGELGYAVMVSNGRMGTLEIDDAKDVTARVAWSPWVWGERTAARRDEVGGYAFWQQGSRDLDGERAPRVRRGAGVKLEKDGWRARIEVLQASGMLESGSNPPFPGQPVRVATHGQAVGGHAFLHYGHGHAAGGVRYDTLWRGTDTPSDLRIFQTVTLDAQAVLNPRARLLVDYELRWLGAPHASDDARTIARTLGDRVSVQAVAVF